MASAFQVFSQKKKKLKPLKLNHAVKTNGCKSSTSLPQDKSDEAVGISHAITKGKKRLKAENVVKKKPKDFTGLLQRLEDEDEDELMSEVFQLKNKSRKNQGIHSATKGENLLGWMISPLSIGDFFESYWENNPLYIERGAINYYDDVCTLKDLLAAFENSPMHLLKNVTVTSYENGKRTTDVTPGRARPNAIRDFFNKGHSIRVLNPQTFVPSIGVVVGCLQEYFRCMVGVNSYYTPRGTQGFAPHYDDIEAFVLQLDGEKLWKVYAPRSESETLPRFSSPDFDQSELGEPILEVTLKAGDLLYFPRGFIHQARSVENHSSLHLTISAYQCNTWGDYFKIALPMALDQAIDDNLELRQGLPLDFIDHLGILNSQNNQKRKEIINKARKLFNKVVQSCPWDDAADQMGKEFIHSSFPPQHSEMTEVEYEKLTTAASPKALIRLITNNCVRMTAEDELAVYYSTDNSLEPRGEELLGFAVSEEEAAVLRVIKSTYPNFCKVSDLMQNRNLSPEAVSDLICVLAQRALLEVKFPTKKPQKTGK